MSSAEATVWRMRDVWTRKEAYIYAKLFISY